MQNIPRVKLYQSKVGNKLSETLAEIGKEDKTEPKIHVVVDLCDIEELDYDEVRKLKCVI